MEAKTVTNKKEMIAEESLWDQMVLEERRVEADKRGIRVCDIEEEASLTLALEESRLKKSEKNVTKKTESTGASLSHLVTTNIRDKRPATSMVVKDNVTVASSSSNCQDDVDDSSNLEDNSYLDHFEDLKISAQKPISKSSDDSTTDSNTPVILQELSIWQLLLPQELGIKILGFLGDIDMCGYLLQVAKSNCFRPTESVYKALCEHIYTAQSRKKKLIVENWESWRNMLGNPLST